MDSQRVTLLVLLDSSATFDTVDHEILLRRLTMSFGISGKALAWFSSFSVSVPTLWNALPASLHNISSLSTVRPSGKSSKSMDALTSLLTSSGSSTME